MRPSQIEAWALRVYDVVRAGRRNEDSRVELKLDWIPARKAARRLAGHANAARGEDILWLFGIDENTGTLQQIQRADLANWLPQVRKEFQGPEPECTDVVVHADDGDFLALLFSTDQAPYVVRNRREDGGDAGPATREVPWREGTAVRTSTHADLLRLLVPITALPDIELISAIVRPSGLYSPSDGGYKAPEVGARCRWEADITLYVTPPRGEATVFPIHRCSLTVDEPDCLGSADFRLLQAQRTGTGVLLVADRDYAVEQPGRLALKGTYDCEAYREPARHAQMALLLRPAGTDREIRRAWRLEWIENPDTSPVAFRAVGPL